MIFIEMDKGFFEGDRKKDDRDIERKHPKELDRQVKAAVAVSTTPVEAEKQKKMR